jgi:hypothetical protein
MFIYFHNASFSCWLKFFVGSLSLSGRITWTRLPHVLRLPSSKSLSTLHSWNFHFIWQLNLYSHYATGCSIFGAHPASNSKCNGKYFHGDVIRLGCKADHSPPFSTKLWMCIAMAPISHMSSQHGAQIQLQLHNAVTCVLFLLVSVRPTLLSVQKYSVT